MKKCSNNEYSQLVPDLLVGDLAPDEAEAVTKHLESCPACQEHRDFLAKFNKGVRKFVIENAKIHPTTDNLVRFAEERSQLDDDQVGQIELHLLLCEQCQEEHEVLLSLERELATERSRPMTDSDDAMGWLSRSTRWFLRLLTKPAFAYSVAAVAIIVASVSIIRLPASLSTASIDTEPFTILTEQTRATNDYPVVTRAPEDNEAIRVVLASFWPDTASFDYSIAVFGESRESVLYCIPPEDDPLITLEDFADFGENGMTQFLLNSENMSDGRYGLIVIAIDKADATDTSMTVFLFEILTEE